MATIDDKVVAISFESSKFEQGVNKTISSLDKLKSALHFPNAGKGLTDIDAAAKKVNLSHISQGVDKIRGALEVLRLVGISVLGNLAASAVRSGAAFIKAFTIDPILAGYKEYATNLQSIQTILANTQAAGTNLKDVTRALDELNEYSDKTIYNFSQMAKNIGTFTAAGVALEPATAAIKGIANLAALSGSNADQASTAMYQLSQALSAGRVTLMDWNSVVNAGMGGTVFQRALAQTAEVMGTLKKGAVELTGPMKNVTIAGESFRSSLSAKPGETSWLTSDVLTNTLKQFTSDLSDAELAAMGFNAAQIKAIQQTAKTAMFAATEVKTLTQVLDVAKETAGSGWAQTWRIIFGDFVEAKTTFTALSNTINGFINANADARNKVLQAWKDLGGRTVLIDGIRIAFRNLGMILAPIKEAFRDVFPAKTGKDLYDLTVRFKEFAQSLKPSEETVENLKRTFRGFFALLDIGKQIISGIFSVFGRLFGAITDGSGGFLEITGSIGDFIFAIDEALKKGKGIEKFFDGLGDILAKPIELLGVLAETLADLFSGFSSGGFVGQMSGMATALSPMQRILEGIAIAWGEFVNAIKESESVQAIIDGIIQMITSLGTAIGNAATNMNFDAILAVVRTGLLGGLVLMLKNFFGKGSFLDQISKGFAGGIISNIAGSFGALEKTMVGLQQNIKAKTLKEIAIAIALLAASVLALSLVDPKRLNSALAGITIMMGQLLGAMAILDKIAMGGGFLKLPVLAAGLIVLAGAIDILTIAVVALSFLSWEDLLKGLGGVGALLAGITAAAIPLGASSAGMIRAGAGITVMAIGMNLLAIATKIFSTMDMVDLAKGLGAVATGLVTMAKSMQIMPKGMVAQAAALVVIGGALNILARAVEKLGSLSIETIGKGLLAVGGALVVIAVAMSVMPKGMVLQAAALMLVALSLGKIADAVEQMGGMSITTIAKGLGTLAGALVILGLALVAFSGTIGGAVSLTIAATGISLLAGALNKMGGMSWTSMIKSLVLLAAAFAIIGAAAMLITPAVPAMLGFGAALVLIGAGLALAGAGIFLIGAGLSALLVAAPTAAGIIVAAIKELAQGIIENARLIALAVLEIAKQFAAVAPEFTEAIVKILASIIDAIIQLSPKMGEAFIVLITVALDVLKQQQGPIIQAGIDLIMALLQGIRGAIPELVRTVADIIVKFLGALGNNLSRIIAAGLDLLIKFISGIVSGITQIQTAVVQIITKFLGGIADNLGKIATAGLQLLTRFIKAIADNISKLIDTGADAVVEFVKGVGKAGERIVRAARESAASFMNTLAEEIPKFADDVFKALIKLINGMADVIEENSDDLQDAGKHLGWAIIDGMTFGLAGKAQDLYDKLKGIMGKAKDLLSSAWDWFSPSGVTKELGKDIILGMVYGLDGTASKAYNQVEEICEGLIQVFNDVLQTSSPSRVLQEIGKWVGEGFAQGLRESSETIRSVFEELNQKLTEAMVTARETIASEQKKLKELREADKPDAEAIAAAQKVIDQNEELLRRSLSTRNLLTGALKAQKAELIGLTNDLDALNTKIDAAIQRLADARQLRDQTIQEITDQYSDLPEVPTDPELTGAEQLAKYKEDLKAAGEATAQYAATLEALRQLGLDDATYEMLVKMGTAGQQFAEALLAGGPAAIAEVNKLDTKLQRESEKLGRNVGRELHQAGVDSAKGFLKGLLSQRERLLREIEDLANEIVARFNKILSVKSPSRVFMEIGGFIMQGLAKGISSSTKMVTDAIDDVAKSSIDAMKSTIRKISDSATDELSLNPVITPVLDLTQIRSQAKELGALTQTTPITATNSYGQAAMISNGYSAWNAEQDDRFVGPPAVTFEQNNYSPEALTEIEIYRQTKNQLSQLKTALALT
jgi:tape measure domain-containing protein